MLVTIDASSIIYGWDNYPIEQFPGLWEWLCEEVRGGNLCIPRVAFDEVKNKSEECSKWMQGCNIQKFAVTNDILRTAVEIHELLGIENENYHPKGVGENDIVIVAIAKIMETVLVSNESIQISLPQERKKYKIPAVCHLSKVDVKCIDFLKYLKESGRVF
ncbi:MAG: DUF4411 family protein [Sulfurovum sp.]|nr:DUF4411 family protein [Sulfurovum sp.]MCB4781146.1 DUF4411 family protein [Sulfurovum sp.]MCB4784450.1 DUF4411 family protein [Sulfurovum sp.]